MGIPCFFVGDTWGYLGILPFFGWGYLGIPGDTWGYLGIPGGTYLVSPIISCILMAVNHTDFSTK